MSTEPTEIVKRREFYYHLRNIEKKPITTICLIRDENGLFHRGIAICSPQDNPEKAEGRKRAYYRALKALTRETTDDPVLRFEAEDIMYSITDQDLVPYSYIDGMVFLAKSSYDVELTEFEKKITTPKPKEIS
jgi:hypothetical protein